MPGVHTPVLPTLLKPDHPGRYETLIITPPHASPVRYSGIALLPIGKLGTISLRDMRSRFLRFDYVDSTCRGATIQLLANCYSHCSSTVVSQEVIDNPGV